MSAVEKDKKNVVLICGSDELKVSEQARAAVNQACPPADQALALETIDGNVEIIDAAVAALKTCLLALQTVGFFGAAKTVWLRDALLLGDADLIKNEFVKAALADVAAECKRGLLPGVTFIISSSHVDGRTSFYKTMQAVADVRAFELPDRPQDMEEHARDFAERLLQKAGLDARADALDALIAKCGGNRELANEVEKLALYILPRKQFTVADVEAIVSPSREMAGWDLADHFGRRNLPSALRTLRQLVSQKESPHGLIAGLEGRIRDLLILKECLGRKWLSASERGASWSLTPEAQEKLKGLGKDPTKTHPYRTGLLARQAAGFSMEELLRCHRIAVETHEQMLSSPVPADTLLEFFMIKALGKPRHAPAN